MVLERRGVVDAVLVGRGGFSKGAGVVSKRGSKVVKAGSVEHKVVKVRARRAHYFNIVPLIIGVFVVV